MEVSVPFSIRCLDSPRNRWPDSQVLHGRNILHERMAEAGHKRSKRHTQTTERFLLRGNIDKFSLDALVNMLSRAGRRVEMKVKKAA